MSQSIGPIALVTVLIPLLADIAVAEEAVGFDRPGPFVGLDFSYGYEDFDKDDVDVDDSLGFSVYLGQRIDSHFSVGLRWEFMSEFETSKDATSSEVETHTLMGTGRFYLLTQRIQPFLAVGFGLVHVRDDDGLFDDGNAFGVQAGGGLDFYLTDHVVLGAGAGYVVPATDLDDVRYVSIHGGVMYRF
ncbi:MAG: outer membrane beta-barrel protein [Myxococcota bacterium]